jgi:hypothetical protein
LKSKIKTNGMKNLTIKFAQLLVPILLIMLTDSCKQDLVEPEFDLNTFEGVIASGGTFEAVTDSKIITPIQSEADSTINGAEWTCKREKVTLTSGAEDFPLFNTAASVIYPGSLLVGNSLENATPDPIAVDRAGGTISYNLNDGNPQSSFSVDVVSKSKVQDAMNNIIINSTGKVPSNFVFEYSEVQSQQQLSVELGINVKTLVTKVGSKMNFSSDKSYSRYLVKLTQAYYTMSFDLPSSYDDLFAPNVEPKDLSKYITSGSPGTYISDVTYGRIYYMLIESTESSTDMAASINASFNGFVNKVSGNVEVNTMKQMSNLKVKVIAFGGDAEGTISLSGETDISIIADRLAASTKIELGLPLSYVVRSIYDNTIVNVKLATEYDVITCVPSGPGTIDFLDKQILNPAVSLPYTTLSADINGDGLTDLVLNHKAGNDNQIQIAMAQGNGTFVLTQVQTHPSIPAEKWTTFQLKTGDINGDKKADLIWNYVGTNNRTYIATSKGDGTFEFGDQLSFPNSGWSNYKFFIGDFNGDTYADAAWNELNDTDNRLYTAFSNGTTFDIANYKQYINTINGWTSYTGQIADTNGDGKSDFVWQRGPDPKAINTGVANGNGTFTRYGYSIGSGWANYQFQVGDINKDGYDDMVFVKPANGSTKGTVNVFKAINSGGIDNNRVTTSLLKGSLSNCKFYLADINADGAMDIVLNTLNENGNTVNIGLSVNNGTFNWDIASQYHPSTDESWQQFNNRLFVGRSNSDQKDDLIWVDESAEMKIYVALAK